MEPLAPAIIAALTPKEHAIRFVDERLEEIDFAATTDLVGISVCTFSAKRAYAIAAKFRHRGVPVVLGGFHPTLLPEEASTHADAVVTGDAEASWPQVVRDALAGRLRQFYRAPPGDPMPPVTPDRSIFRGKHYLPLRLVQFGRGCPRSCGFCAVRAFYGGGISHRAVASVVAELQACGKQRIFLVDDNLLADRHALRELLEAMIPLGLRWSSQLDLSIADDPGLLDLARRSGCQCLVIGLESLHEPNLQQMGKAWHHAADFSRRLARIRQAGIMVYGTFLFGYDGDTPDSFKHTLDFAMKERLFIANFNPLQPLPGTPLYARLQHEGRLVYDRWWMEPGYRWHEALVKPRGMTPQQLTAGCRWARERFSNAAGIIRRLPSRAHLASPGNLPTYLIANWLSRRDILTKTRLGEAEP